MQVAQLLPARCESQRSLDDLFFTLLRVSSWAECRLRRERDGSDDTSPFSSFFFPPLPRRGKHCYKPTVDTGGTLPPAPLFLIKLKYSPSLRHRWSKMFLNGTLHCNLCCKSWPQASVKFRNGDAIKQFSASGGEGEKNGVTFCSISHPFL